MIEEIAAKLRADYPPEEGFRYGFEVELFPKMRPDIFVLFGERCICVVEIGYTRPEKLSAYRYDYLVPDVRWYGHDGQLYMGTKNRFRLASMLLRPTSSTRKTVFRTKDGTVRVYIRRHINGCPLLSVNDQHCDCPKWISVYPRRSRQEMRRSARTPNFEEACEEALKLLESLGGPVNRSAASN